MAAISKDSITFLKKLGKNNDRDWFQENKPEYVKQHEEIIAFADELLGLMNEHDTIETISGKKSLYRIYRDVRFSKVSGNIAIFRRRFRTDIRTYIRVHFDY